MKIVDQLRAARRSFTIWLNAMLLAAFPFADQIMLTLNDALPELAPYLPANVYKWMGLAVVLANIVRAARRRQAGA